MRKTSKSIWIFRCIFAGLLLIGFSSQSVYGAQDEVKTYSSDWKEATLFKHEALVIVTASDGETKGGTKSALITNLSSGETSTVTLYDDGLLPDRRRNDGVYTTKFVISTYQTGYGNFQLYDRERARIEVDLDGRGDLGEATIIADYTEPEIYELSVSEEYFSPMASYGKKDTTLITFKSNEKGRYKIWINEDRIPRSKIGTHTPEGQVMANETVYFQWDGFDKYGGKFLEGTHTIKIQVWDEAKNSSRISTYVVGIDNTPPVEVSISLTDEFFSPGASLGIEDTTGILLRNDGVDPLFYELSINEKILQDGRGSIPPRSSHMVVWNGQDEGEKYFDEGRYTIVLKAEDPAGNSTHYSTTVTIDNTPPRIDYLKDDSGGKPCYRNQQIGFILKASDWIGTKSVEADGGRGICVFYKEGGVNRRVNLIDCKGGIYAGYYTVTREDVGTFTYFAYFVDKAGNPAINTGVRSGTITLRGNELNPAIGARIVRLRVATPEKATFTITSNAIISSVSTMTIKSGNIKARDKIKIKTTDNSHIWIVSAIKDGEVTISNADIFFGFPIANYNNVNKATIREGAVLKRALKIGDEITINLTAVNILDTLIQPTQTTTNITFEDSRIATGTLIVVYDNNNNVWLGTASRSGKFEASNANIYSAGKLIENYRNLEGVRGVIASFAVGGKAFTNMGIIVQGISLYDNGAYTHKDIIAGDGVYSNCYAIKKMDDTTSYFYGYFSCANKNAENNGIRSQEEVVIDATPPNITNFGAFPGIFRPGVENVTIKYTLLEEAEVTIEIWDQFDNCIRTLTIPEPQYGDNCNAIWDGKNMCGGLVEDGTYYFKINAVDKAGNSAIERVGVIKATNIEIKITELKINPSVFTPTPEIKEDVDFYVEIRAVVKATEKQLQNLGFEMDPNNLHTLPYLLVKFTYFDARGNEIKPKRLPDLTEGIDTDPFTNGYPNYYAGPGTQTVLGILPKLGTDLPDEGDGNKENDWDILVPLHRDPQVQNQYYTRWGVGVYDWETPDGTYLMRLHVELVGSYWKFIDYKREPHTNRPIAEMWHQKPNHGKGESRTSEPVEGRIEVIKSPIIPPDHIPPAVIMTSPGANTIHEPTENISVIVAKLMDAGGSGLDLIQSTIILKNSIGMVMAGTQTNNGIDTVMWILKEPLTTPDVYKIEVRPVDKAKNGLADRPQIFTFTILDRVGPKIYDILVDNMVLKSGDVFGPNVIKKICVTLSELETGNSKVDFATSKIIIKEEATGRQDEPHKLFGGTRREEIFTENSGRIIYENLTIDKGGTYTIWVEAWDKAPTPNFSFIPKIKFHISVIGYTYVEFYYPVLGTKAYLSIPPDTKARTITTTWVTVGTNTIAIRQGTVTKRVENYAIIDPVIEFWWFNNEHIDIILDPPQNTVITLTMYYGHITLPPGVKEEDLAIWRYNGVNWAKISGVNDIDKNENKITINLPVSPNVTLEDQYAIMYLIPRAVNVQYHHYKRGLVTCLKIPEATTANGQAIGTETITVRTLTVTRSGYVVIEPVIQFYFNGVPLDGRSIEFDREVTLIMYYTEEDVDKLSRRGLTEKDLGLYEYDGREWRKVTVRISLDEDNKQITYKTRIIREKYAIMYVIPEIVDKPTVFEQSVYAYPNPAKDGRVVFRYDLIRDAKVTLKIYTIMGDEVWSKEYSPTSPQGRQGSHGVYPANPAWDIIWNCENNEGKKVASGLYIYVLTASDESGEVSVTNKLIVIQ